MGFDNAMSTGRPLPSYIAKKLENIEFVSSSVLDDETYISDEEDYKVPTTVKRNLQELISSHPEGIWCCDLPRLYRYFFLFF